MFTLNGKLKVKKDEQVISEKFKKREFVVTDESSQYPQDIAFQLAQDRTSLIDTVNEGDNVTVYFNLRGREWTSPQGEVKYFNTLDVWKVEAGQAAPTAPAGESFAESKEDDLPF
jgi:hypothetical protein